MRQCKVFKESKYDRHPLNPELKETPIAEYLGQVLHIDIYSTERYLVLTAIDKISKLSQAWTIESKALEDVRTRYCDIVFYFAVPMHIVMDNEKSFNSQSVKFMLEQLDIEIYSSPHTKGPSTDR